jgi:hypothetical protein
MAAPLSTRRTTITSSAPEDAVFEQWLTSALKDLIASVDVGDAQAKIDAFLRTLFSLSRPQP